MDSIEISLSSFLNEKAQLAFKKEIFEKSIRLFKNQILKTDQKNYIFFIENCAKNDNLDDLFLVAFPKENFLNLKVKIFMDYCVIARSSPQNTRLYNALGYYMNLSIEDLLNMYACDLSSSRCIGKSVYKNLMQILFEYVPNLFECNIAKKWSSTSGGNFSQKFLEEVKVIITSSKNKK